MPVPLSMVAVAVAAADVTELTCEPLAYSTTVVPAATPAAAVTRLNTELVRALGTTDIRDKFRTQEMAPEPSTAEQFAGLLQSESARYSKVVKAARIRAE